MSDFFMSYKYTKNLIMSKLYFWERDYDERERERKWTQWDIENPRGVEWRERYLQDLEARRMRNYEM